MGTGIPVKCLYFDVRVIQYIYQYLYIYFTLLEKNSCSFRRDFKILKQLRRETHLILFYNKPSVIFLFRYYFLVIPLMLK